MVRHTVGFLLGGHFPGWKDHAPTVLHNTVRSLPARNGHTACRARRKAGRHVLGRLTLRLERSEGSHYYYIWGSDGSYRQLEARYEGAELQFPVPSRSEPQKVLVRSVWRRVDASSFEVRRERLTASEWKPELTVTYRREAAAQ